MRKNKAIIRNALTGPMVNPNYYNFTLVASNGKTIASSNQGYVKKSEAKRILRKYFPGFEIVEW